MKYLLSVLFLVIGIICAIGSTLVSNDLAGLTATILAFGFFYGFFHTLFISPLERKP